MDYSLGQISQVLNEKYGITIEQAIEINGLSNYEYVQYIESVVSEADENKDGAASLDDTTLTPKQEEEVNE